MELALDLDLPGVEEALRELLPKGIRPTRLVMDREQARLEGQAALLGRVALVARVQSQPGRLTLSGFDLEGAGLARGLALSRLRDALGRLDKQAGPFRVFGEPEGDRLQITW